LDAKFAGKLDELRSAAETLWAEFEEKAVAAFGANDAAGTWGGFDDLGVDSGLVEVIGEGEAGDSGADDEDWDVSGHEVREPSYHFEFAFRDP